MRGEGREARERCGDERDGAVQIRASVSPAALCVTRARYRQGRRLTAVKVYSACAESTHVLVCGVPALNLSAELTALLCRPLSPDRPRLRSVRRLTSPDHFTETYHVVYADLRNAVAAKKQLDTLNWYGGVLHVCYSPEFESVDEARSKLQQRRGSVRARLAALRRQQQLQQQLQQQDKEREQEITSSGERLFSERASFTHTVLPPDPPPPPPPHLPCFLPPDPPAPPRPPPPPHGSALVGRPAPPRPTNKIRFHVRSGARSEHRPA